MVLSCVLDGVFNRIVVVAVENVTVLLRWMSGSWILGYWNTGTRLDDWLLKVESLARRGACRACLLITCGVVDPSVHNRPGSYSVEHSPAQVAYSVNECNK